MFLSPPDAFIEALTPNVMVLEDGPLGGNWSCTRLEGRALMMGLVA